jgi:homocysteine S-methyltransferase
VIGVNCSVGPQVMLGVLERLRTATSRPLAVQPNAGPPREVDGRTMFLCTPDYLEKSARRFLEAGARLLGGCCGTTPEHVRALAKAVKRGRAVDAGGSARAVGATVATPAAATVAPAGVEPAPLASRSRLGRALVGTERPLLVELLPPKGRDVAPVLERAARLRTLGVTAINLPDGARAAAKMSPLAVAVRIQETTGVEAVLHVCCRDRNLLGLQADLLAASALGLRDVLLITGDPPIHGDYPDATAADGRDRATKSRRGQLRPRPRGQPPGRPRVAAVGLNPMAVDPDREIERFRWKVDAEYDHAARADRTRCSASDRLAAADPVLAGNALRAQRRLECPA